MRCVNCGWDNAPGATSCVKCNHPLQATDYEQPELAVQPKAAAPVDYTSRPTVVGASFQPAQPEGPQSRPTVVGASFQPAQPDGPQSRPTVVGAGFQPAQPQSRPTVIGAAGVHRPVPDPAPAPQPSIPSPNSGGEMSCPACGYPIVGNPETCPACGKELVAAQMVATPPTPAPSPAQPSVPTPPISQPATDTAAATKKSNVAAAADTAKCPFCEAAVTADDVFCPACGKRIPQKTMVGGFAHHTVPKPEPPTPECSLTLIPEDDEQTEATQQTYKGDNVVLNRANTEPGNLTITSREQAVLTFEDGKWYIENRSDLQSTFIRVSRKLELQKGDVVVLGDRRFTFDAE